MRASPLVLVAAFATSGCLSFTWERQRAFFEPPADAVATITTGSSTLQDCIERLGAPLLVEEYGEGMALYWGWTRDRNRGISVSIPLSESYNASVSYADADLARNGLLVVLDRDLVVELHRYGRLADLVDVVARRRPQLLEEADTEGRDE